MGGEYHSQQISVWTYDVQIGELFRRKLFKEAHTELEPVLVDDRFLCSITSFGSRTTCRPSACALSTGDLIPVVKPQCVCLVHRIGATGETIPDGFLDEVGEL